MKKILIGIGAIAVCGALYYFLRPEYEECEEECDMQPDWVFNSDTGKFEDPNIPNDQDEEIVTELWYDSTTETFSETPPSDETYDLHLEWDPSFINFLMETYPGGTYDDVLIQSIEDSEIRAITSNLFEYPTLNASPEIAQSILMLRDADTDKSEDNISVGECVFIIGALMMFLNEDTLENNLRYLYYNSGVFGKTMDEVNAYFQSALACDDVYIPNMFGLHTDNNLLPIYEQFLLYREEYMS